MVRRSQIALLLLFSASASMAQVEPGRIRTVDIPPSQPEPIAPPPEAVAPDPATAEPPVDKTSDGLVLDLPSVEEARSFDIDGDSGSIPADMMDAGLDAGATARAIAAIEAIRLREANARQLAAARQQLDRIQAEKQAERDRLARYREASAAHAAAMADYEAQAEAARAARRKWERDVAACQAGDRSRCGPPLPTPQ